MERALDLLDQIGDVVQVESGPEAPKVSSFDLEGLARGRGRGTGEPAPEGIVDHLTERATRPSGHRL